MKNFPMFTPAFPVTVPASSSGLTKLEYVAAIAMQGLLTNDINEWKGEPVIECAQLSVQFAYYLLKECERIQSQP